jgi:hypothetical protein
MRWGLSKQTKPSDIARWCLFIPSIVFIELEINFAIYLY